MRPRLAILFSVFLHLLPATPLQAQEALPTPEMQWHLATPPERIRLAEEIGEAGARRYARARGWSALQSGRGQVMPQGLDQVYRSTDGLIHVIEAKGGGGKLGTAYGHLQGSVDWALKCAERTLKSSRTSFYEKRAAMEVLEAGASGRLRVLVVRTRHVLGRALAPELASKSSSTAAHAGMAGDLIETLKSLKTPLPRTARAGEESVARAAAKKATAASEIAESTLLRAGLSSKNIVRGLARKAGPVAAAVDAGLRVGDILDVEADLEEGRIDAKEREIAHVRNVAGYAGTWAGMWAGSQIGAATAGAIGTVVPGVGTGVGLAVGSLAGGLVGFFCGEQAALAAATQAIDTVHASGTTVADSACAAAGAIEEAALATGEAVSSAATTAGVAVKDATVATGEIVADAAVAVGGAVKSASVATGVAVRDATVSTGTALKEAGEATGRALENAGSVTAESCKSGWNWFEKTSTRTWKRLFSD